MESYDDNYQIARLRLANGYIQVAHRQIAVGATLRLRILARDVSISLAPHQDTSVINQLHAQICDELAAKTETHITVRLDACGIPLLAKITRQSHDRLQLSPGKQVWAQFKATAVMTAE